MRHLSLPASAIVLGAIGCGTPAAKPPVQDSTPPPPATAVAPAPRPFRIVDGHVVADTFDIRHDLRDSRLTLALSTDLGDAAELIVNVWRIYHERGSSEEYPIDYFSERSTVAAWRAPRTLTLDNAAWKRALEDRQRLLASAGEPFTVSRIESNIVIRFVMFADQKPPFESANANLRGAAATSRGNRRVVESEAVLRYPIDASGTGQARFADPLSLAVGKTYRASKGLPLVPELNPADPLAAAASIRQLQPGAEFTVLEAASRRSTPWYRVTTTIGEGWINSVALLGQELAIVR